MVVIAGGRTLGLVGEEVVVESEGRLVFSFKGVEEAADEEVPAVLVFSDVRGLGC